MNRLLLAAGLVVVCGFPAAAHGIECSISRADAVVVVRCGYDEDTPVAKASVRAFAPSDVSSPFQVGETDANGVFGFLPDREGTWRVVVDDGTGHRLELQIGIDESSTTVVENVAEHQHLSPADSALEDDSGWMAGEIPLVYKAIFGLALIFGATGVFYGLKARQK